MHSNCCMVIEYALDGKSNRPLCKILPHIKILLHLQQSLPFDIQISSDSFRIHHTCFLTTLIFEFKQDLVDVQHKNKFVSLYFLLSKRKYDNLRHYNMAFSRSCFLHIKFSKSFFWIHLERFQRCTKNLTNCIKLAIFNPTVWFWN